MEIAIWGAGIIGKRVSEILPEESVKVFIDSNVELQFSTINNIPVVSFDYYLENFKNLPVLVSPLVNNEILKLLEFNNINHYWILADEPMNMYTLDEKRIFDVFENENYCQSSYLIKGTSLYSTFLYDYLESKACKVAFFYDDETKTYLDRHYSNEERTIESLSHIDFDDYDVLLTEEKYFESDELKYSEYIDCKCSTLDSVKKKINAHKELCKFKNLHKSEKCIIVANGPSLTMDDLDKIHKSSIVSFGVNLIHKAENMSLWRPDYYVVSDVNYANYDYSRIFSYKSKAKFVLSGADEFWKNDVPNNIYKYFCATNYSLSGIDVSEEIEYGIYVGMTVIHACIQIAMYMGFNEIYLIGADTTKYSGTEKSHFIDKSEYWDEGLRKLINNASLDVFRVMNGYASIKKFADSKNIRIYNATRGGALEVFNRVDFDSIF